MTDLARNARDRVLTAISEHPSWVTTIRAQALQLEPLRAQAAYNTGTISEAAALYLRALTFLFRPGVVIEIGTFIGTSASAMLAGHIYTCDKDNDCFQSTSSITTFPKLRSTRMLQTLVRHNVKADFFFFDGRIKDADLPMILQLAAPNAVFTFDDHEGHEKGVINVEKLLPHLSADYTLIEPPARVLDLETSTTIAVLVPEARL